MNYSFLQTIISATSGHNAKAPITLTILLPRLGQCDQKGSKMIWAQLMVYVTGTVDQELLLRNELCLAKTSYTRRMNDLRKAGFRFFRYNSCHDCVASTFPRLVGRHFPFSGGPRPREPGSPSTIAGSACATTSPSIDCPAQAVLGCVEIVLVWVEKAARLGYSSKCRELASSRVSFVLVMDLESQTIRRAEACQQRDSHLDLSYGCRESDLGSAAHSRRTSEAGLRGLGKECLTMDPASSKRSRFCEAMADVPQKPLRGHCGDGLFHRPNAHVRCSVLFFRHRPRAAKDPAFQRDAKSPCTLGCTTIARSMGLQAAAQVLAI